MGNDEEIDLEKCGTRYLCRGHSTKSGHEMHERSLLKSLLNQVDEIRRQHGCGLVTEVRIEIGPLSGVDPLLLTSAFEQLAPETMIMDATLRIDEVTLRAECKSCRHEFEVHDFVFRCSECGGNVRVTRGDEIQLVSVSVRCDQPTQELTP